MYWGSILYLIPLFVSAFLFMLFAKKFEGAFSVFMSVFLSFMAVMPIAYRIAVSRALKSKKPGAKNTVVIFVNGVPVGAAKGNKYTLLTVFLVIVFTIAGAAAFYGIAFLFHKMTKEFKHERMTKWILIIASVLAGLDAIYIVVISAFFRKPRIGAAAQKAIHIRAKYGWTGFQPVTGMVYGAVIFIVSIAAVAYVIKAAVVILNQKEK